MSEVKKIMCSLVKEENETKLKFEGDYGVINFTKDSQGEMKSLFNKLLSSLVNEKFEITISEGLPEGVKQVYLEVSKEYIKQLNEELSKISERYKKRYSTES